MDRSAMARSTVIQISQQDLDMAKGVARKIFDVYDKNRSQTLENFELPSMMEDTYRIMNRSFQPTQTDVDGYFRVLDRNNDGRITLPDLEALCIRYLVGEGVVGTSPTLKIAEQYVAKPGGEHVKSSGVQVHQVQQSQPQQAWVDPNTPTANRALEQARRLFAKYDVDKSGFIDQRELHSILEDTYKNIGITRTFSQEDIDAYFRMADTNDDGLISLQEYEQVVLRSLANAGIKF